MAQMYGVQFAGATMLPSSTSNLQVVKPTGSEWLLELTRHTLRDEHYVERVVGKGEITLLQEIHKQFEMSHAVVLEGPSGIGKSTAAYRYSQSVKRENKNVCVLWICAENRMSVQRQVLSILRIDFKESEQVLKDAENSDGSISILRLFAKRIEDSNNRQFLAVLDNVNAAEDIDMFLVNFSNLKVLITTRETRLHTALTSTIQLKCYSRSEAVKYLYVYLKTEHVPDRDNTIDRIVWFLAEKDALYPCMLKVASLFIRERGLYGAEKLISDFQHVYSSETYHHLGHTYYLMEQFKLACEHLEQAVRMKRVFLRKTQPDLAASVYLLALTHKMMGQLDEAIEELVECVTIYESAHDNMPHSHLIDTLEQLVSVYEMAGRYADARDVAKKVEDLRKKSD